MKFAKIPMTTITRLCVYVRNLEELSADSVDVISSEDLARQCDVNAAQIRKDLAYFGEFGVRGVGYHVNDLLNEVKDILGLNKIWNVAIAGIGNLGIALLNHANFIKHGYIFVAAVDKDSNKIGQKLKNGLTVESIENLPDIVKGKNIEIGIIATPADTAQGVANQFVLSGVKGILNFAPSRIQVPESCAIKNVDFSMKMDTLAYFISSS